MDPTSLQIQSLLQASFTSQDTATLRTITAQLHTYSQSPSYLSSLCHIAMSNVSLDLVQAAISQIKTYIKRVSLTDMHEAVSLDIKLDQVDLLYSLIKNGLLPIKNKKTLVEPLQMLLRSDEQLKASFLKKVLKQSQQVPSMNTVLSVYFGVNALLISLCRPGEVLNLLDLFQEFLISSSLTALQKQVCEKESDRVILVSLCMSIINKFIFKADSYGAICKQLFSKEWVSLFRSIIAYSPPSHPLGQKESIDQKEGQHKMTRKTLQVTVQLLQYLDDSTSEPLHQLCLEILSALVSTLPLIPRSASGEQLIVVMLKFIRQCCESLVFYSFLRGNLESLLDGVVVPLLISDQEEHSLFQQNEDEFTRMAIDCTEGQFMATPKVGACELLLQLAESLDGACSTITTKALSLLSTSSSACSLDLAIILLDVIHPIMINRPDLLSQLEQSLNQPDLLSLSQPEMVRARLCLLLGHFSSAIFKNDSCSLMKISSFLMDHLSFPLCRLVALHSLNLIMDSPSHNVLASAECLSKLIKGLPAHAPLPYWTLMTTLLKQCASSLLVLQPDLLSSLLSLLVAPLLQHHSTDIKVNMQYDLLLSLASQPSLAAVHSTLFLESLAPLMDPIPSDPTDLLDVLAALLSSSPDLPDPLYQWLLSKIEQPDILLQVSLYNKALLKASCQQISQLVPCCVSSALRIVSSPDFFETDKATAMLCIQLSLQRLPSALPRPDSLLMTISEQITLDLKERSYQASLVALLLQITFFLGDGLVLLLRMPTGDALLQMILNTNNVPSLYAQPYFRQTALLALAGLFRQHTLLTQYHLQSILLLFIYLYQEAQTQEKKEIPQSDDSFEATSEQQYLPTDAEFTRTLKHLDTPVMTMDYLSLLRQAVQQFKEKDFPLLSSTLQSLSADKQQKIKDVLQSQQVQVNDTTSVPRRIFKIKAKE